MKEIIINKCYGGFGVSNEAKVKWFEREKPVFIYKRVYEKYKDINGHVYIKVNEATSSMTEFLTKDFGDNYVLLLSKDNEEWFNARINVDFEDLRTNPEFIQFVKDNESIINDRTSSLKIVKIPKDAFYQIYNYDGIESIIWSMSEINETY